MKKKKTVRNEQTSKRVASKAGKLMTRIDTAQDALANLRGNLMRMSSDLMALHDILDECHSVAASALTQAPDRKKKVK